MKASTKQYLELVGLIGVIGSLVFVGMQLRLESRVALAEQYAFRAESAKSDLRSRMESQDYLAMEEKRWNAGYRPVWWSEDLATISDELGFTATDIEVLYSKIRLSFLSIDNFYYQYNQGLLPESFWLGSKFSLKNYLRDPFYRAVLSNEGQELTPVIQELLSDIEEE